MASNNDNDKDDYFKNLNQSFIDVQTEVLTELLADREDFRREFIERVKKKDLGLYIIVQDPEYEDWAELDDLFFDYIMEIAAGYKDFLYGVLIEEDPELMDRLDAYMTENHGKPWYAFKNDPRFQKWIYRDEEEARLQAEDEALDK